MPQSTDRGLTRRDVLRTTAGVAFSTALGRDAAPPNIVILLSDDVGWGDLSCYGATAVQTPNLDRIAKQGLRFTDAHSSAATCTPSRFSLLTGLYSFRNDRAKVLPGDAPLLIEPGSVTLPSVLQKRGYRTGVVGKWHLGLGVGAVDWNHEIQPGPREVGFDESFIIPATGDRVPTVYVENGRVANLDPNDPIEVSYDRPVGNEPTGRDHPELLRMKPSHGHDFTIVNGISRIGYMSGGRSARWVDEDMADVLTRKAVSFIERNRRRPFFLYFATHDIHVPRAPHDRFTAKTPMGRRGDVIAELDWSAGQVLDTLDRLGLASNTLFVFSSDNGPVVDDGYRDEAVEKLGSHKPAGPYRGGKYSSFEAGTRVPLLVRWPGRIQPGVSNALVGQVDFLATFAKLTGSRVPAGTPLDSADLSGALTGKTQQGREFLVEQSNSLSLRQGTWKYIPPANGSPVNANVGIETGNSPQPQLYDLQNDPGERSNLAASNADRVRAMAEKLAGIRQSPGKAPGKAN